MRRALHVAWLVVASVAACLGLAWALFQHPDGHSAARPTAVFRYLAVMLALAAVSYALHRRAFRASPSAARQSATVDAVLVGGCLAPLLFFVLLLVETIHECGSGAGC
jgi:hypothetical protein